jgi:hypothetical protein
LVGRPAALARLLQIVFAPDTPPISLAAYVADVTNAQFGSWHVPA